MKKILYLGFLLTTVVILLIYFSYQKPREKPPQRSNASVNTPSLMAYPRANGQDHVPASDTATSQPKSGNDYERQTLSELLSTLTPPKKPAWEIVQHYKTKVPKSPEDEAETLAALSYCINMQGSSDALLKAKGSGTASAGEIIALQDNVNQASKLCNRLLDSDYEIRSDIVSSHARKGDTEAMLAFMDVGPLGRWQADYSTSGIANEELNKWKHTAISYLEQAAMGRNYSSLNTLATIYSYSPKSQGEQSSIFSDIYDPVKSYQYAYAWVNSMTLSGNEKTNAALTSYLKNYERNLSTEQIQLAQQNANKYLLIVQQGRQ